MNFRRIGLTFIVIAILIFLPGSLSAKCKDFTLKEMVEAAESIVIARIESANTLDDLNFADIVASYSTTEQLKGPDSAGGMVWASLSSVGIELVPGITYLLFVSDEGYVGRCTGSKRIDWYSAYKAGYDGERIKEQLQLLEKIKHLVRDQAT